jgi:hypothetical protein
MYTEPTQEELEAIEKESYEESVKSCAKLNAVIVRRRELIKELIACEWCIDILLGKRFWKRDYSWGSK